MAHHPGVIGSIRRSRAPAAFFRRLGLYEPKGSSGPNNDQSEPHQQLLPARQPRRSRNDRSRERGVPEPAEVGPLRSQTYDKHTDRAECDPKRDHQNNSLSKGQSAGKTHAASLPHSRNVSSSTAVS